MNIAVILSGGVGERFGSDIPKQYLKVNNKMIIEYVIETVLSSNFDKVLILANSPYRDELKYKDSSRVVTVEGGASRNKTIQASLDYIKQNYYNVQKIIFFDAVRPFVDRGEVDSILGLLDSNDCVVRAEHITDTLGGINSNVYEREEFYLVQTPEAFRYDLLVQYFDVNLDRTAIYQHLPNQIKPYAFFSEKKNLKLTYKNDMPIFELLLKERQK